MKVNNESLTISTSSIDQNRTLGVIVNKDEIDKTEMSEKVCIKDEIDKSNEIESKK